MSIQSKYANLRQLLFSHHPSAILLAAQFVLLLLYAIFDGKDGHRLLISAFGLVVLLLVLWVVTSSSRVRWMAWIIAIPAILLSLLAALTNNPVLIILASLLEAILYFYTAGTLIGYMLEDTRVTTDELFAVGATFTLLAWGFAHAYYVCLLFDPGSILNTSTGEIPSFLELLFLSFTNLSATGLGDIMPLTAPPRVLAMLEQFCGVGYVAMVVSRLIGLMSTMR
ncbi:MAG TPA: ion channel, partial [Anaerolineaceae bacterium]|nr:ion channel [Anaerolineaceae bacterium]